MSPSELKRLKAEVRARLNISVVEVEALSLKIERFFHQYLDRITDSINSAEPKDAVELARALVQFENALKGAGFQEVVNRIEKIYGDELDSVRERLSISSGSDVKLTAIDVANVQALANDQIDRATRIFSQYVGDARSVILSSVVMGAKPDIKALRDDFGSRLASKMNTEINTALAGYSRAVNSQKAAELNLDKFLYFGPDDDITRPFCQERVDKIFTQEQVDDWDNGSDLPAGVYCGGYNCRHQLLAVSDEFAKELNE